MSDRGHIAVVHTPGPDRDALLEALADHGAVAYDPPQAALGVTARVVLADASGRAAVAGTLTRATPLIALVTQEDDIDELLQGRVWDIAPWPGSTQLLLRRLAPFISGDLGPSRVLMDPARTTSLVHAIRNPLNVITLYAELLKMEPLSEDALGSVGRLVRAAKRVDALVGELETLLYLQAKQAPLRPQPLELSEVVEAVVAEHGYDVQDKPLTVTTDFAPSGTVAMADADLARRAVHAAFGRTVKLCLGHADVQVRTIGSPPRIEIEAPITPIPPEHAAAFQSPGTELDVRESLGGVGVGLSFAHVVLESQGGRLEHDVNDEGRAVLRLVFAAMDTP